MSAYFTSILTWGYFDPTATLNQALTWGTFFTGSLASTAIHLRGQFAVAAYGDQDTLLLLRGSDSGIAGVGPKSASTAITGSVTADDDAAYFDDGYGMAFDGASSLTFSTSNPADWALGDTFTLDFWCKVNSLTSGTIYFLDQHNALDGNYLQLSYDGTRLRVYVNQSSTEIDYGVNVDLTDTWHHIALRSDGGSLALFIDGTLAAFDVTVSVNIDDDSPEISFPAGASGYIDEYRIVKGRAEWIDTFTPPAERYRPGEYQLYYAADDSVSFATATATFYALPWRHEPAAPGDHHYVLRYTNPYGLATENITETIVSFDGSGETVIAPPAAPTGITVLPAADAAIRVQAVYLSGADGDDPADRWLVYATVGSDPDPDIDSPAATVTMKGGPNLYRLDTTLTGYSDGDEVHVLVRTDRLDPAASSANTTIVTATADATAPDAPGVSIFANGEEVL